MNGFVHRIEVVGRRKFQDASDLRAVLKEMAGSDIIFVHDSERNQLGVAELHRSTLSDGSTVLDVVLNEDLED
jgi:hypothetical protein